MKAKEKYLKITDFLKPTSRLLSYPNIVEYALPAFVFTSLLFLDFWIIFNGCDLSVADKFLKNALPFFSHSKNILPIVLYLVIGWLMYITRFHHYFPGFLRRNKLFFNRLAEFYQQKDQASYTANKYKFGKEIYYIIWKEVLSEQEKKEFLKQHANWVSMMHIVVSIMISFIIILTGLLTKQYIFNEPFPTSNLRIVITFLIGHITFFFYFRRAALKWHEKANYQVIKKANIDMEKISPLMSKDLSKFIND